MSFNYFNPGGFQTVGHYGCFPSRPNFYPPVPRYEQRGIWTRDRFTGNEKLNLGRAALYALGGIAGVKVLNILGLNLFGGGAGKGASTGDIGKIKSKGGDIIIGGQNDRNSATRA